MLSCSLDPDQDLESGSKLFTWHDVCFNIRGGDYVLVVKFSGGDYVLVVKFSGGDYILVVKFMRGILSLYTKMSRGGFVRGDFVLHSIVPVNSQKYCLANSSVTHDIAKK